MGNDLLILFITATVAILMACVPLFKLSKRLCLMIAPLSWIAVCMGYLMWGGYVALSDYHSKLAKAREVDAVLASPEKTRALIARIKARLDDSPSSASGWVLIGKLYLVLHDTTHAKEAFERAARQKK